MASPVRPSFDAKSVLAKYGAAVVRFGPDRVVYAQGDAADSVFYIHAGKVKLSVVSEQGREAVIAIHAPGDLFGKDCLAGKRRRVATAATMTDCVLAKLVHRRLTRAWHESAPFRDFLLSHLSSENLRLTEQLLNQLFDSSEKRLARTLLLLADFETRTDGYGVIARIDQKTLAKMVGTTRPRVSFFMNKFRRLGFVEYNGDIHVHRALFEILLRE